ncbi:MULTISPECIES: hypothetical protein [Lysobacter]|uniref:hypothetical protein n=1 Tax=Lysobacter TaxID=68 RepID=UPI0004CFEA0C|nr:MULTISPECIES: hypothetical protein [Lysobacter]
MSTLDNVLQLQQPVKEGGIRTVNFFNGRLLTSKDLTREQVARREADARLGLALGDGVAFGLEAARDADLDQPSAPVLRVRAGLAVNRAGQTLCLTADTSVALTRRFDAGEAAACDCVFANCNPLADGVYVAGAGVYVLTIAPAQTSEGRAPTNGLDPSNVRCNTDTTVDGVQFRLLALNPLRFADLDPSSSQFRNRLAYRCFGIEARDANALDPWQSDPPNYGLVDELRDSALSDCDVPIALVYWTSAGLNFVDTWAVRRRLLEPDALSGYAFQRNPLDPAELSSFAFQARVRRLVETHAMCAQFQQHLADLLAASAAPSALIATQYFRYLPPFGIVPLHSLSLRGFSDTTFFTGIVRRPAPGSGQSTPFIDARQLGALQAQALASTPTDVNQKEFVWVYRPWQNVKASREGEPVQPMLVFASGQLPDIAVARFDMARLDYSNLAGCCGAP